MNDHTTQTDLVRRQQTPLNPWLPGNYANMNPAKDATTLTGRDYLSQGGGPLGYSGRLWEAPADDLRRYAETVERLQAYRMLLLGDYVHEPDDSKNPFGQEVHTRQGDGRKVV